MSRTGFDLLLDAALDKFEERGLLKFKREDYHYCKGLANMLGRKIRSFDPNDVQYDSGLFIRYARHLKHWHRDKKGIIILPINVSGYHWIIIIRDENGSFKCFDHYANSKALHDSFQRPIRAIHALLQHRRGGPLPDSQRTPLLYLGTGAQHPEGTLCGPWAFNAIEQVLLTGTADVSDQSQASIREYRANLLRRFMPWMKFQGAFARAIKPLMERWDEHAQ